MTCTSVIDFSLRKPGSWFNIKMSSYQHRKSHCGDKTVIISLYLHNRISYSGKATSLYWIRSLMGLGWVGLWGFLWWAPSAKGKDHHGVSSGWSSVWHCSNTGLSSSQYEQIPIILGVWPFCLTPFFFRSITFWRAYGWIIFPLLKLLFLLADILLQHRALFQC